MRDHFTRFLLINNAVTAVLAIVWAYASYRYDLLEIGRGTGSIDFWDGTLTIAAYSGLAIWLVGLIATTFGCFILRLRKPRLLSYVAASALIGPMLVSCLSWWLHQSIPP